MDAGDNIMIGFVIALLFCLVAFCIIPVSDGVLATDYANAVKSCEYNGGVKMVNRPSYLGVKPEFTVVCNNGMIAHLNSEGQQ
jgi:hypothetical protein